MTNPLPYFLLLPLFIYLAGRCDRFLPAPSRSLLVPLESFRGILATSVLFCHAVATYYYFKTGVWNSPPSRFYSYLGTAPVILFFVMSAFLFWSKLLRSNGIPSYGSFLAARTRRLVPAYFVSVLMVMLVVLVLTHFSFTSSASVLASEIASWLIFGFHANSLAINGFADAALINASVTWTLRFEILFYLLLPILFPLFKGWRVLLYVALTGLLYFYVSHHFLSDHTNPMSSGRLPQKVFTYVAFFGFGFGSGMLIAFVDVRSLKRWRKTLAQRRWTPIPICFLAVPPLFKIEAYSPLEFLALAVVFVFVVAGNDMFGLLSLRGTFILGRISYSFYVIHGVALFALSHVLNSLVPIAMLSSVKYWMFVAFTGVVAIAVAMVIYCYVEVQFMTKQSELSTAKELVPIVANSSDAGAQCS